MANKQDELINKIFDGLCELSERIEEPTLAQLLLQTLLATNALRQELVKKEAVIAAEFNEPVAKPDLTLMTLGQIKKLYPEVRGTVTYLGSALFDYLINKHGSDCVFKDYVESVYGGDYFGNWDHYVDRHQVISI